tara:strand:- start:739 stop:1500 length:762 start_codon:yes stop_codon:yes gene_type:complete
MRSLIISKMNSTNMFDIIPAIDLIDGKIVRLTQGDYDEVTHYQKDPVTQAIEFEQSGAKRLHLVDLDGAKDGKTINFTVIESIRKKTSLDIEIGGGIRTKTSIQKYLDIGINQVILGSLIINDFQTASELIDLYPSQVIAGLDIKDGLIATQGWIEKSTFTMSDFLIKIKHLPLHSIIYTDISKDGMMSGPDFDGLKKYSSLSHVPLIASGGIRGKDDINKIKEIENVSGAIIGKALLSGSVSLKELFNSSQA